jgi:hypothetical protein
MPAALSVRQVETLQSPAAGSRRSRLQAALVVRTAAETGGLSVRLAGQPFMGQAARVALLTRLVARHQDLELVVAAVVVIEVRPLMRGAAPASAVMLVRA